MYKWNVTTLSSLYKITTKVYIIAIALSYNNLVLW